MSPPRPLDACLGEDGVELPVHVVASNIYEVPPPTPCPNGDDLQGRLHPRHPRGRGPDVSGRPSRPVLSPCIRSQRNRLW